MTPLANPAVLSRLLLFFLMLGSLAAQTRPTAHDSWSRFRGPNGTGVTETEGLPVEFGPEKNVVWKTGLPIRLLVSGALGEPHLPHRLRRKLHS